MNLFVTQVSDFDIPDIDTIGIPIIEHVLNQEKEDVKGKQYSMRGRTGYHSLDDLASRNEDWSVALKNVLHAMIQEHAAKGDRAIPPAEMCRIMCWAMVMRDGDYSSFHNHPSAMYSGVLYLKVPELDDGEGQLVFVDPRPQTRVGKYYDQHVYHRITPKKGDGYVFPNWLDHFVEPHFSGRERISLSFNLVDMGY